MAVLKEMAQTRNLSKKGVLRFHVWGFESRFIPSKALENHFISSVRVSRKT